MLFDYLNYSYYFPTEIAPIITEPSNDVFVTQTIDYNGPNLRYECVAEGIPIPLVYWFRNGTRVENTTFDLEIKKEDLDEGRNVFVCVARNRQGIVNRTVSIVVTSDQIDTTVIEGTNELINNQVSLDGEQATNVATLVDSVIMETVNGNETGYAPDPNDTLKSEPKKITLASNLFLNVIARWNPDTRRNGSNDTDDRILFNTNAGLLNTTRSLQKGTTEQMMIYVSQVFVCQLCKWRSFGCLLVIT